MIQMEARVGVIRHSLLSKKRWMLYSRTQKMRKDFSLGHLNTKLPKDWKLRKALMIKKKGKTRQRSRQKKQLIMT